MLWYLLTTPTDRLACSLWTREIPDRNVLMQSCGLFEANGYRIDVVPLGGTAVACTRDGAMLPTIQDECNLPLPLDQYRLRIVKPKVEYMICSVTVDHEGPPTRPEIQDACGVDALLQLDNGTARWDERVYQKAKPPENPPTTCAAPVLGVGFDLYDQAPDAAALWTDDDLSWLAGRMIWYGMVLPSCEGGRTGLDPHTLAANGCGMAAARQRVTAWQNQYNAEIYAAAVAHHVPARLIKRIIAVESQYWPSWTNAGGEAGMLQVSANGVDVLLRYDPDLDPNYPRRTKDQQYWQRLDVLRVLACAGCGISQAVEHMRMAIPIYARLLAAYRCRAVEMDPALSGVEAWRQAVIDYNGDQGYLRKVEG